MVGNDHHPQFNPTPNQLPLIKNGYALLNHLRDGLPMNLFRRFSHYLERRWVAPAYVGWVLLGLAVFFFAAATNTLSGWLYVMSGLLLALLAIAAILPPRNLSGLKVERQPIRPVCAGDVLVIALRINNIQRQPKVLFQALDLVPNSLGPEQTVSIRAINPGQPYDWTYQLSTQRRGLYTWSGGTLRSAAPLGLFWSRRHFTAPASVIVYPQIFRLSRCPIVDALGTQSGQQWQFNRSVEASTEGVTRALRPYRWGDPTRLIHWRTSARYGELRVREMEVATSGQEVLVALDQRSIWSYENFEQAVVAAASLYTYALNRGFVPALWTPQWGTLRDYARVMSTLAEVEPTGSAAAEEPLPNSPLVWLTEIGLKERLPPGSRRCCWGYPGTLGGDRVPTLWIEAEKPLIPQLQGMPD
jgi:uncharacterized protein (DUF58 family)